MESDARLTEGSLVNQGGQAHACMLNGMLQDQMITVEIRAAASLWEERTRADALGMAEICGTLMRPRLKYHRHRPVWPHRVLSSTMADKDQILSSYLAVASRMEIRIALKGLDWQSRLRRTAPLIKSLP